MATQHSDALNITVILPDKKEVEVEIHPDVVTQGKPADAVKAIQDKIAEKVTDTLPPQSDILPLQGTLGTDKALQGVLETMVHETRADRQSGNTKTLEAQTIDLGVHTEQKTRDMLPALEHAKPQSATVGSGETSQAQGQQHGRE